jgi:hypothetical protein
MWVVVPSKSVSVLLGGIRKPARRDDHPALWAVEVERRDRRVELLDDRAADRASVFTLDDDPATGAVDNLLHHHVPPLVGRFLGLADVFVAEVSEHILDHVLELEPREIVQYCHPDIFR